MNDGDIGTPKMVGRVIDIPGEILLGRWVIWADKWAAKDDITPDEWRARIAYALRESGVQYEMHVMPDQPLTLIWNKLLPPTRAQLDNAIHVTLEKLKYEREHGR